MSKRKTTVDAISADLQPSPADVRTSGQRATELRNFIHGLLPAHISRRVDVHITTDVPTAAVLPARTDALLDGGEGLTRDQAQQIANAVDGDYLVLVTGRPAPIENSPLTDQLSADRAHQYGLVLHETLHILKTSFGAVSSLLEERVEDEYRSFVHNLINATEDGAIEHEVYTGDDFSRRAGIRLRLIRRLHKRGPDEYADLPDEAAEFTLGDALQQAIHDAAIHPPSGTTDALVDDSDSRITFASDDDRAAFMLVYDEIQDLASDIHAIRGDDTTTIHHNDLEASVRRARRTIQFWEDVLKPLIQDGTPPESQSSQGNSGQSGQQQGQEQAQTPSQGSSRSQEGAGESARQTGETPPSGNADDAIESGDQSAPEASEEGGSDSSASTASDVDPDNVSLKQNAVDSDFQDLEDHPELNRTVDPSDVPDSQQSVGDTSQADTSEPGQSTSEQSGDDEGLTETPGPEAGANDEDDTKETAGESTGSGSSADTQDDIPDTTSGSDTNSADDEAGADPDSVSQSERGSNESSTTTTTSSAASETPSDPSASEQSNGPSFDPSSGGNSNVRQLDLSDFAGEQSGTSSSSGDTSSETTAGNSESPQPENNGGQADSAQTDSESEADTTASKTASKGRDQEGSSPADDPHAAPTTNETDTLEPVTDEDLDADRSRAEETAAELTPATDELKKSSRVLTRPSPEKQLVALNKGAAMVLAQALSTNCPSSRTQ